MDLFCPSASPGPDMMVEVPAALWARNTIHLKTFTAAEIFEACPAIKIMPFLIRELLDTRPQVTHSKSTNVSILKCKVTLAVNGSQASSGKLAIEMTLNLGESITSIISPSELDALRAKNSICRTVHDIVAERSATVAAEVVAVMTAEISNKRPREE